MARLWSCKAGTSWTIVKADNPSLARQVLGERLGYAHKPWLWETIEVKAASKADVERYGAIADAGRGRSTKITAAKRPREKTATRLIEMVGQSSLLEDT